MKKSKRAKASTLEDKIDRISKLPDDLLHSILSRLPTTEEIFRTSILSTRWRYLSTSFSYSSIDISFTPTPKAPSRSKINTFEEFMSRVLANESLELDFFSLFCPFYHNVRRVGRWIDTVITRNVKTLHLLLSRIKVFKVPDSLVNNGSLQVLRLFLYGSTLRLPNSTRLPSLRVLELFALKLVDDDLADEFLKSCPSLENLRLTDCLIGRICISCPKLKSLTFNNLELDQHMDPTVVISCPKLEFWEVAGYVYHNFLVENLDSLKKAVFHPKLLRLPQEVVLDEIEHPGMFSLAIFFDNEIEVPDLKVDVPPLNPKTLELITTIDFLTKNALFSLLKNLPDLESLHLTIIKGPFWPTLYSNLGGGRMAILTYHLKRVDFVDFNGEKEEVFVTRVLLKHGRVLKKMVFNWGDEATYNERSMEIMNQMSSFHKASSTVKLITLLKH